MIRPASFLPPSLKRRLWPVLCEQMHLNYRLPSGIRIKITSYSDWCIYNDIFVAGEYDPAIHAALDNVQSGRPFRIVDLGANVGFFTLRVLDLMVRRKIQPEQTQCLLVEGSPRLQSNLHYHLDNIPGTGISIRIVNGLVGLKAGAARLELNSSECMNHVAEISAEDGCIVNYYDLHEALGENDEIDLLKCDIEGSEKLFIDSYPALLRNTRSAVFEFHDPMLPAHAGIPRVMDFGFAGNHVLLDQGNAITVAFQR